MNLDPISRRAWLMLGAAALALAGCGGGGYDAPPAPAPAPVQLETVGASLNGDQEAPLRVNSGATGTATFSLDRSTRTLSGSVSVDGVVPTAAHIHLGAAGAAGVVVVPLTVSATYGISLPATVLTADQLASLDAGELYVNVHSAANPNGEIRGQIGREVYVASLNGAQETAGVSTSASGEGVLVLDPKTRAISGEIEFTGITATAAHIHAAAFGSDGAVAVTLEDHGGHGHFIVPENTVLSDAQVDALRAGGLYFNAHSAAHPSGEIRGQIGRHVLFAFADGSQEVPSTASAANGHAALVYDPQTRALSGSFTVSDMTATLAHIHVGEAGTNGGVALPLAEATAGSGVWSVADNTMLSAAQAQALLTGGMYVNAHSTAFGSGEIRGQIGREVYTASLSGAQETTPVSTTATGAGFIVLNPQTLEASGSLQLAGITATAAHVHAAPLGSNGSVVVTLEDHGGHFALPAGTVFTQAQADSLRAGGLYFNAHSAANPGGEIRGQIGRRVVAAAADGTQEVTANASAATGRALLAYDPRTRGVEGSFVVSGMTSTLAHIHAAPAGSNGAVALSLVETPAGSGVWAVPAATTFTAQQAQALLSAGLYVNAHSAAFPGGEIRGQLLLQ